AVTAQLPRTTVGLKARITSSIWMSYQSIVALKPLRNVGVSTTPRDFVSDDSGFRFGLPAKVPAHCAAGHWNAGEAEKSAYCAAVSAVWALGVGWETVGPLLDVGERGSVPP